MVDRGPDDGQPQGDVDCVAERDQLYGDQTLIVVARNHGVELATHRPNKHGIGWEWPVNRDPARPSGRDGRREHGVVFTPHQAVLTGMWIEPGEGQPRRRPSKSWHLRRRQRDGLVESFPGQLSRNVSQRDMHGRQHDAQDVRVEHHRDAVAAGQVRQQLRVPAPGDTCCGKGFLINRRGSDPGDSATLGIPDGGDDGFVGGLTGLG